MAAGSWFDLERLVEQGGGHIEVDDVVGMDPAHRFALVNGLTAFDDLVESDGKIHGISNVGSVEGEDDGARLGDSDEHTPSIQTDPSRHSSSQAGATAKNRSSTSSHSPEAQSLTEPC